MSKGLITNIQRFSLHDGPGIRSTVFFSGCPLACTWCHNPETKSKSPIIQFFKESCSTCGKCVDVCPEDCFTINEHNVKFSSKNCTQCGECVASCPTHSIKWSAKEYSSEEVVNELLTDIDFFKESNGGITLSGGEPLLQLDFAKSVLKEMKSKNIHTAVDTCGFVLREQLDKVLEYVDLFLYDVKIFNAENHEKHTGRGNQLVFSNLEYLVSKNKSITIRTPLIPKITDSDENLLKIKKYLEQFGDKVKFELIPYNMLCKQKYEIIGC